MAVLGNKDSDRMETTRFHTPTDPVFWSIDNRPLSDLEERTKDLDELHKPSRGFKVRGQDPATSSIEVEAGFVVAPPNNTLTEVALATLAITATAAGFLRKDLVWYDVTAGSLSVVTGTTSVVGLGFGGTVVPALPAAPAIAIPLAIINVDETPTPFDLAITSEAAAGHIKDVRVVNGAFNINYELTAANLKVDTASGVVGTATDLVRSDHQHPINVDATVPEKIVDQASGATVGTADTYARRDHEHELPIHLGGGTGAGLGGYAIGLYGIMFLDNSVILGTGAGVQTADISASTDSHNAIVIPANTFPNGIIVDWQVELSQDISHSSLNANVLWAQVSLVNDLGGGSENGKIMGDDTAVVRSFGTTDPVLPAGYTALLNQPLTYSSTPGIEDNTGTLTSGIDAKVVSGRAIWVRSGSNVVIEGPAGAAGEDWDPALTTTCDFDIGAVDRVNTTTGAIIGRRVLHIQGF